MSLLFRTRLPSGGGAVVAGEREESTVNASTRGVRLLEIVGGLLLMFIRGILLWLVIPIAFLAWVLVHGWAQHTRLRHALAWYDFNTVSLLMNGPLRLMFRAEQRPPFVGVSHMGKGEWHRVSLNDLL